MQLLKKLKKNEKKAQKRLYDQYSSLMLGICMRYTRDRSEAEDVLQEGFLKIFVNINQYSGKGSFEGWMKRIMVNTAITFYNQNLKHHHHKDIDEIHETIDDQKSCDSEFTHDELLNVIKELPDGYRMVFNMYAVEGYKHKEIAEMLGVDVNTSKSQYSRAKKMIQRKLHDLCEEKIPDANIQDKQIPGI